MAKNKLRNGQSGVRRGGSGRTKGEVVLVDDFNRENSEDHRISVVHVEHGAGDRGKDRPLRERAGGPRLVPIPKEKSHDEGRVRVGPRGIEIHVER